jgi:hypothetical protein
MLHAMSLAEIDEQHVELLPTRTLMSLMTQGGTDGSPGQGSGQESGAPGGGLTDMLDAAKLLQGLGLTPK